MKADHHVAAGGNRLAPGRRLAVGCLGAVLLAMLLTARWLEPAPRGFGTHRGLGLPRCTFVQLCGVRCPSCGMTTSWAHLTRGQIRLSLESNVGGALLGLMAIATAPWAAVSAIRGRPLGGIPNSNVVLIVACVVLVVTLTDWVVRLLS